MTDPSTSRRHFTRCDASSSKHAPGEIEHHLKELEIARDVHSPKRALPIILDSDETIIDLGCGIGQSLIALDCLDRRCIGVDLDPSALRYGAAHFGDRIHFVRADAARLPLSESAADLVFSRVALPYTNIPKVVAEMRRVLRPSGRLWMTLHSRSMVMQWLADAIASRNVKAVIFRIYALLNGYSLKYAGRLVPFLGERYESWQDINALARLLSYHGFETETVEVGHHHIIEATLPSATLTTDDS